MPAKKIMAIDDERDILKLIHGILEKYDHNVDIFSDPVKALGHFQQHSDGYGLLLVDVRMPGMSGFELYQELRKRDENVKVCFLTAFEMYRRVQFNVPLP